MFVPSRRAPAVQHGTWSADAVESGDESTAVLSVIPGEGRELDAFALLDGAPLGGTVPVAAGQLTAPTASQRRAARRLAARKVSRLVRHIDPFSVLRLAGLFYICVFLTVLGAGVILWTLGRSGGVVAAAESFVRQAFALEAFSFDGPRLFRFAVLGGLALTLAATALTALAAVMFNMISDLTGGIRLTVIQEETARPVPVRSRR